MLAIALITALVSLSTAHRHGAPCASQYTMKPNVQFHGEPQNPEESPVPYFFSISDSRGQPINRYKGNEVYTLRLYGGKTYFRGFLIQGRLATRDRFIIGHLRAGEFVLKPESLERYGIQMQSCPPAFNDSVTHVDSSEKKFLEINWRTSQNDGPVQFVLTVVKDRQIYWTDWKPESGFILPDESYNFQKHASQKLGQSSKLLSPALSLSSPSPISKTSQAPKQIKVEEKTEKVRRKKWRTTTRKTQNYETTISDLAEQLVTIPVKKLSNGKIENESERTTEYRNSNESPEDSTDPTVLVEKTYNNETGEGILLKNFKPQESVRIGRPTDGVIDEHMLEHMLPGEKLGNLSLSLSLSPSKGHAQKTSDPDKSTENDSSAEKTATGDKNNEPLEPAEPIEGSESAKQPATAQAASKGSGSKPPSKSNNSKPKTSNENILDPCSSSPCKNAGGCVVDSDGGFVCNCTGRYTGFDCAQYDHCLDNKCKNGGTCVNEEFKYTCECPPDFAGEFCQVKCEANFCENGECVADSNNKPSCSCSPGFTGKHCESDIDECASNPCVSGATCEDRTNAFHCVCPDGFMGDRCHRPCQDIYKSCNFWKEQDQCELRRPSTNFFDINCAVACEQCVFDNNTIVTDIPIPPLLEPLEFLLGQWYLNSTDPKFAPIDFEGSPHGYYQEVEFSLPYVPMFGSPSFNYSSIAISNDDKNNMYTSYGFMTLKPNNSMTPVSLMTTQNIGVTMMEEGFLKDGEVKLELVYLVTFPGVIANKMPATLKRTFGVRNGFLQESVIKASENGTEEAFTKYYYRKTH